MSERRAALARFYRLLDRLDACVGGPRILADCHGGMSWPRRGIYFFYETGETRPESGRVPRVVHVGTHALTSGSRSTLWQRLSQHRGPARIAGGSHRGSVFRLLVGAALASRDRAPLPPSWGIASSQAGAARRLGQHPDEVRAAEADLETRVSRYIGAMPFLWLNVDDPPGPDSRRSSLKRGAVALLSGYGHPSSDPPSPSWLGRWSDRDSVRRSGLWNSRYVDEPCDPTFLDAMARLVSEAER